MFTKIYDTQMVSLGPNELICFSCNYFLNSLWSSDTIWRQKSGSTLAQVMACCLTAPSHYLNQCWLIFSEILWRSHKGNFRGNIQESYPWYEFENYQFKIAATSPRGQWVNRVIIHILLTQSFQSEGQLSPTWRKLVFVSEIDWVRGC